MGFPPDDIIHDALEGVEDPLSSITKRNDNISPFVTNETIPSIKTTTPSVSNETTSQIFTALAGKYNKTVTRKPDGKIRVPTSTPGYFTYKVRPITEKTVVVYGGSHYPYDSPAAPKPYPNNSEDVKIFWNSVGEAVESVPFLPVQLNVPDMISAMTTFLVNYIPFLNRIANANQPRPQKFVDSNHLVDPQAINYYETVDYDHVPFTPIDRREYRVEPDRKGSKKRRKNKRKNNKNNVERIYQKATTPKKIFQFPSFKRTTESPFEDTKLWNAVGSDQKETFKLKNMPISRKRIRVADREVFNFKNSDISNSPIMILNVPQRPITHYKIIHQESSSQERTPIKDQLLLNVGSQVTERSLPKQKRKLKTDKKSKKRTEKSLDELNDSKVNTTTGLLQ
ncbi:hypothetical protein RUM44_012151 [Polyplax serrata]|uniref:Uncharacterized protein n=1 Tax=Polyplax serrata TaxID=468196 RepID=A0ABR1BEF2_POLSC